MKLYALTSIEADDKDRKMCGECQYLENGHCHRFPKKGHWPRALRRNNMAEYFRCPACLRSTAINPFIETIEKADIRERKTYIEEEVCRDENCPLLRAALDLKGKLIAGK